ncbi:MaoC/PaaZ C-terminal domain-containing protein [Marinobacter litoralis]|uniref:MaoC/PaaZ C-terminal domain-containing protein n=1 Tax=Marinobacter litoralis TaxID=187981 RepID=UPI0018EC5005|nr:MaoC/PaaZ C-terminal domain-containing protein [Marinobacter litoralis]MBJ6136088.1 MaoC family dehydratase N-terminal domain-containing protein [Marinobacter litoralis]
MAIDYDKLLNRKFETLTHDYTEKDTMLYALGVGLGNDPLNEDCLQFVYEDGLKALPSMSVVLAYPGFWVREPDTGIDWVKVLHAGQEVIIHKPLPASGVVEATTRITEIIDKGEGRGALIVSERVVRDKATGEDLCTLRSTTMARGDGGFGGPSTSRSAPDRIPEREPDLVCDLPTLDQAALIYRLSGDFNPLHASPSVARKAGFEKPILHGLCTFGVATHALLKTLCDYDPARFHRMRLRFSAPVYPGETIRTEMWRDGNKIAFRCRSVERDLVVINNGYAEVS